MSAHTSSRQPDVTRRKLLEAAFDEFYLNGFQGSSLKRIAGAAGVTKGALFHHFPDKRTLGLAVVDDVVAPLTVERWLAPLEGAHDPITAIQDRFRSLIRQDTGEGAEMGGCPLNNLAQEMSPLDEGFRIRIDGAYRSWRDGFARALARGVERGLVRDQMDPEAVATLLVVGQMGIWGTGKVSLDRDLMVQAGEALCAYLETLRPRMEPGDEPPKHKEKPR